MREKINERGAFGVKVGRSDSTQKKYSESGSGRKPGLIGNFQICESTGIQLQMGDV